LDACGRETAEAVSTAVVNDCRADGQCRYQRLGLSIRGGRFGETLFL
jgi:hypothetical protein